MLQCSNCEFCKDRVLTCDPCSNIKEPECLTKWMLVRICNIEKMQAHEIRISNGMMPLQAKVLQHSCAQIDELQNGESWKHGGVDDESPGQNGKSL